MPFPKVEGLWSIFHLVIIQKYMRQGNLDYAIVTTNSEFQWFNKVYFSLTLPPSVSWLGTPGHQGLSRTQTNRDSTVTDAFMVIQAGNREYVANFALVLETPWQKWHVTSLTFHWPKQVIWAKQAHFKRRKNENLSCSQWEKDWNVYEQPQGRPQHLRINQPHQKSE